MLLLQFTAVACPRCNARVGQFCRSRSGWDLTARYAHTDRARAFGRKFPKPSLEDSAVRSPPCAAAPEEKRELIVGRANEPKEDEPMWKQEGTKGCTKPHRIGSQNSFDEVVKALHLSPQQYANSTELRAWVRRNKSFKYVPPDILLVFGFKPGAEV